MKSYIGIDPGKSGAIAVLRGDEIELCLCSSTEHDQWKFMSGQRDATVFIEKVGAMPHDGKKQAFAFGQSFGFLRAITVAAMLPFEVVAPGTWQRRYGLIRKKNETDTQKKNRHKAAAQRLFPEARVIHATADALLIAHFCREQHVTVGHDASALEGLL